MYHLRASHVTSLCWTADQLQGSTDAEISATGALPWQFQNDFYSAGVLASRNTSQLMPRSSQSLMNIARLVFNTSMCSGV
jgi:hypothetical protein